MSLLEKIQSSSVLKSIPDSLEHSEVRPTLPTREASNLKKSALAAPSSADALSRFLLRGDARDHAWPHLLTTRQYAKAADILLEEGCKETRFLGRRKLLLSLAKLAYLTSDTVESIITSPLDLELRDSALTIIELLLECVQIQFWALGIPSRDPAGRPDSRRRPVLSSTGHGGSR
ncbi:unnamed protein product [Echinostoma caproni]|uniref:RICTOR_N domain-containing protein n=1 Tax=Echinostoma caproni TaxID=27848 RepID=A0A183B856_9TREM|nr:unnamed protein product [Echinostoma caproni]